MVKKSKIKDSPELLKGNESLFPKYLNKYLACFASSVHPFTYNTHYILAKVFEILGSGSLLVYPKREEEYMNKIGLFHMEHYYSIDLLKNDTSIQNEIDFILDEKNRNLINKIRLSGHNYAKLNFNSEKKYNELINIIRNC